MILRVTLALLAAAGLSFSVPVQTQQQLQLPPLRQLTQADFASGVAHGLSLIEFFSPYCGHCRNFKPTWQELVNNKSTSFADGFSMAQVDCIAQGDLCGEENVKYYPMLALYKDGKQLEVYQEDRSFEKLSKYVDENIEKHLSIKRDEEVVTKPDLPRSLPSIDLPNPAGEVSILGQNSFDAALAGGPIFVKFYAPWCGHCRKLAPVWKSMAETLKGKLNVAEIDCDAHPAVCKKESIKGYPMMYLYANSNRQEYRGPRKAEDLTAWATRTLAQSSGLQEVLPSDLDKVVASEPSLFLYLHGSRASAPVNDLVRKVASRHAGGAPVYASDDVTLLAEYGVKDASLVALRDRSRQPSASLRITSGTTSNEVDRFLIDHRWPSAFELTSTNFRDVMRTDASETSLIVVAPTPLERAADVERALAEAHGTWRKEHGSQTYPGHGAPSVNFVWMDTQRWTEWLSKMYGFDAEKGFNGVVIADHKRLTFYAGESKKGVALDSGIITADLDKWLRGQLSVSYSEDFFARNLRVLHSGIESVTALMAEYWILPVIAVGAFLVFSLFFTPKASAGPSSKFSRVD